MLEPPDTGDTWLGLSSDPLPSADMAAWVVLPNCGAVVQFSGTARDHSTDRPGVDLLHYEAYEDQVEPRLRSIAAEMRARWDDLGRVAMLHRVGPVAVGEPAVVVAVSSPHRDAAFEAARFAIDTLKTTVPIWKRERWQGGESWGLEAQHIVDVSSEIEPAIGTDVSSDIEPAIGIDVSSGIEPAIGTGGAGGPEPAIAESAR